MTEAMTLDEARTQTAGLFQPDRLVRATLSGRVRGQEPPTYRRVELRFVDLRHGRCLQVTRFDQTQAFTSNVELDRGPAEVQSLLAEAYGNWHVETTTETVQVRVTKRGRPMVHREPRAASLEADRSHDRIKPRRLGADDPIFAALGLASPDGRIKPSRLAKFRQVQDLLAALDPVIDEAVALGPGAKLSSERPLRLADLGCGNAYLTFGALRYLASVRGLPVHAVGVDVKAQSRDRNSEVAAAAGLDQQVEFVQSAIETVQLDDAPDIVLALHACDTATDDALARAVEWQAPVILAAPCCHHDIQRQLGSGSGSPGAYSLITRHGILRERLADVLTDSLRAAILRMVGYRVEVVEFVDTRHTPRNALIRAVRTGSAGSADTRADYDALTREWNVYPALAQRLAQTYPSLSADAR
ncbi:MAG TPA: SAM-dependent methyltransferase [Nocardioidaceae bacterium]|nr:SAM-dependent methyltransferase [Nocardioidaceae bacterium]